MQRFLLLLFLSGLFFSSFAQSLNTTFNLAYQLYPQVPKGMLEAVSYTQTRFSNLEAETLQSCSGMPKARGVMGMMSESSGYFRTNAAMVASISGLSVNNLYGNVQTEILAYANAWTQISQQVMTQDGFTTTDYRNWFITLEKLSFIPDTGYVNRFALDAERFEIIRFLKDGTRQQQYGFPDYHIQPVVLFGASNLAILTAPKVTFTPTGAQAGNLAYATSSSLKSTQYGPAIWNPAPSCNFSSRAGTAVSAITIHTIQGTYAGAISWAQNCNSSVSYHYVIRSSDGQITQMVDEANKAWHVGSENPYTIGYEHEGYVSQPQWYTNAMYTASANLSRDICNSGYGILPLRTFSGAATSGSNVLGSCIKIKGHQHYPNQSHTDPGINWNWALYYQLINNAPIIVTNTAATGNFYDSGGNAGAYSNDERTLTLIQPAGASTVTLNFTSFALEANWDYLYIYDGATTSSPLIGTYTGSNSPGTITSTGNALLIEFRSDCATTATGWAAGWSSTITAPQNPDVTAPTTVVSVPNSWVTQNFTATFTDADDANGSGIQKSYYQVIDYDGTEWRANGAKGFFSDNFDGAAINSEWTSAMGTWTQSAGNLTQSDEANGNTNLYASLNHTLSNRYLYHWAGAIGGTGTNRRAGLHYFCDDPTLPNRGNSYFVYFRVDNQSIQIYKVTNDVFSMVDQVSFPLVANQWYDFKIIYDRVSGKHQIYVDNSLVQTWTDSNPISSGDYFSLRSGNCTWSVNNMKVYRSRAGSATITVGSGGDLRFQNPDPSTPSGRIKSIVQDSAGNLSAIISSDVNLDWTAPSTVLIVNDGTGADISSTTSTSILEANWSTSQDQHSDISRYWYAVGTTAGGSDIVSWTDNAWNDSVQVTGLSLTQGQTYYFSVRAENGAGLLSGVYSSNGQQVVAPTSPPVAGFVVTNSYMCSTDSVAFTNSSLDATSFQWSVLGFPTLGTTTAVNAYFQFPASGSYNVRLIAFGPLTSDTITQAIDVQVSQPVAAAFTVTNDTIILPGGILAVTNNSTSANGYIWSFGDGSVSTDVSPWHNYADTGTYTVQLVAANDACPNDTASMTIVVLQNSGLGLDNLADVVGVYPNPASDKILIRFPAGVIQFAILDASGKLMLRVQQVGAGDAVVNVKTWAAGTYLIQTETAHDASVSRFIKN